MEIFVRRQGKKLDVILWRRCFTFGGKHFGILKKHSAGSMFQAAVEAGTQVHLQQIPLERRLLLVRVPKGNRCFKNLP